MERGEVAEMQEIAEGEMLAKNCRNACQKLQNAVIPEIAECGNSLWCSRYKTVEKHAANGRFKRRL